MNITEKIINEYKNFSQVRAIAIGGSSAAKTFDDMSDIDTYIFVEKEIPISEREEFVKKYSSKYEVGGEYFGSGDEFLVDRIDKEFDVMYWDVNWFENTVNNVWVKHYPSNGYSTCFLYTLKHFDIRYDKNEWLKNLQDKLNVAYPKQLKENIIKRNLMLMKDKPFASYYEQIEKAVSRNDLNSVNHRTTEFISSYFDVLFAVNELLHPGEKRLVEFAKNHCKKLPDDFEKDFLELYTEPFIKRPEILSKMFVNIEKLT